MPARSARSSRRGEAADVNLLAHEQFPEPTFGAAVDGLNVGEVNVSGAVFICEQRDDGVPGSGDTGLRGKPELRSLRLPGLRA